MSNDVKPDNKAAIEFLKRWSPLGPWVLTAIQLDKKAIATATFSPSNLVDLEKWLDSYNGKRNLYFHVNPPRKELTKKAEREDIKELAWLHVDIDPRAGEDLQEEQERALGLLTSKLPKGVPAPTVVVYSGGGYQGFWKLAEPIAINGDLQLAEDAKRYNQQLEVIFGADNCHNIDRIMRLPGSINIPDPKKVKKGRVPTLAKVIEFDESRVYPISMFTPAVVVQMAGEKGFSKSKETVKIDSNIERIQDVSELDQWNVPDRVKVIIVQGRHPEETKQGDNSRSMWVFDCVCQLVRCSVPDSVIFSILTDPEFGIAESIIEKGVNAEKYAIRQIERAKEEVIDPSFRFMNEKHAVIGNIGGSCKVIEEVFDPALKRTRLTKMSFTDIRNRYMNIKVTVGLGPDGTPMVKKLGDFWLNHPQRRQFDTIVFSPGQDVPGSYNLWTGFSCQSKPGDCSKFLEHTFANVCNGNQEIFDYLIGWMARAVQEPATQGEVAIVLRGGRGTGKSFFAKQFGQLFGRHFLQVSNSSHLVGNFNSHLRDTIVLFADEAFYAGDKKHASTLKTLITEETIPIEAKGVDVETAPNFVHLLMASNEDHVVPAGGDERRFLVVDVAPNHQQDIAYFDAIRIEMENGGKEALLHYLMTYDLKRFQVRNVPKTAALQEQKLLSLSPEEEWWYQRLHEGRMLQQADTWEDSVLKDELVDDYINYTKRFNINRRGNATVLGKFLKRIHPSLGYVQKMTSWEEPTGEGWMRKKTGRRWFWVLPSLDKARGDWELAYGQEKWPDIKEQAELQPAKEHKEDFDAF